MKGLRTGALQTDRGNCTGGWRNLRARGFVFVFTHLEPFIFFCLGCVHALRGVKLTPELAIRTCEIIVGLFSQHNHNAGHQHKFPKGPDRYNWVKQASCKCV